MLTANLFTRDDTFFGICEGLGEDFRFNPLWLRLALTLALFFNPAATIGGYLALGLIVLVSRLIFPAPSVAAEPQAAAEFGREEQYEAVEPLPVAA
jgi:phage shock protein C